MRSVLAFAKTYAATHIIVSRKESAEDAAARLVAACDLGAGADTIIDASGAEPCIQTAIHALRMGGTYVQGGMGKTDINFPIMAMCTKELNCKGSFRYGSGDYSTAVGLIANWASKREGIDYWQSEVFGSRKGIRGSKASKRHQDIDRGRSGGTSDCKRSLIALL